MVMACGVVMAGTLVVLQDFGSFVQQGRDWFAGLACQRGQDTLLLGREFKRCLFHTPTVPGNPPGRNEQSDATALCSFSPRLGRVVISIRTLSNSSWIAARY